MNQVYYLKEVEVFLKLRLHSICHFFTYGNQFFGFIFFKYQQIVLADFSVVKLVKKIFIAGSREKKPEMFMEFITVIYAMMIFKGTGYDYTAGSDWIYIVFHNERNVAA